MKAKQVQVDLHVRIPAYLWREFQSYAKRRRRKAKLLLADAAAEFVQRTADEDLLEASCRAAQRTGYREEDAVELVKEFRRRRAKELANGRKKVPHARRV